MKDNEPIKQRYYPRNPAMQRVIDEQVEELFRTGAIEPFRHARYISTLDLKQGYLQIPMEQGSRQYTAITVPARGLYQWKVMPFGLQSACATFQRALDSVIGPNMKPHAFAYLDDIIVIGANKEQQLANLEEVFRRLREVSLRINKEKCRFFRKELVNLGNMDNPTERTNRTVKTMIAQFIEEHQSSWDEMPPEIALAVNTSLADLTGFSPAFLMQGREPRLPIALYDEVTSESATFQQTQGEKAVRLREVYNIVRHNLQSAFQD
ncbi:uncharacterized protein K02A2.6-like [Drosophila montana]|uniref:uncharacterized protein K02A2.6-like n=1 Tax=Drosophila montana TaxID=40370 RepID=UPI00313E2CF8